MPWRDSAAQEKAAKSEARHFVAADVEADEHSSNQRDQGGCVKDTRCGEGLDEQALTDG
jgi:hypothetical protein